MVRILLLFLIVNCTFAAVVKLNYDEAEALSMTITALSDKDIREEAHDAIAALKRNALTTDKATTDAIDALVHAENNLTVLSTLYVDVRTDLSPIKAHSDLLDKIVELLNLAVGSKITAAMSECNTRLSATTCPQPFKQLIGKKERVASARDNYKNRPIDQTAVAQAIKNIQNIPVLLNDLKNKIQGAVKDTNTSLPRLEIPKNFVIPPNLADILEGSITQHPDVNEEFLDTVDSLVLRADHAVRDCISRRASSSACGKDLLATYFDPSVVQAWNQLKELYLKRATIAPNTDTPTDATNTETSTLTTTTLLTLTTTSSTLTTSSSKCCPLLCLGLVPSCPNNNQCGCGCSSCNRGCRSQSKCCNCKDKCCADKKVPENFSTVITKDLVVNSSSSPMVALISAMSFLASLLY